MWCDAIYKFTLLFSDVCGESVCDGLCIQLSDEFIEFFSWRLSEGVRVDTGEFLADVVKCFSDIVFADLILFPDYFWEEV